MNSGIDVKTLILTVLGVSAQLSAENKELPKSLEPLLESNFFDFQDDLMTQGKLIFQDDFNRKESDDAKEELGKNWVTNSKKRAKGGKQTNLTGESVVITMARRWLIMEFSMRHDAPFDCGVVQVRFRMFDAKGIGFNFNDPKCEVSNARQNCLCTRKC